MPASLHAPVRATDEPGTLDDLVADCREISPGVLPPARAVDLANRVPTPRGPGQGGTRHHAIVIRDSVVSLVDGYGDYGTN